MDTYLEIQHFSSCVEKYFSSRALKKQGKTLNYMYILCFPYTLCSAASCVLYNRTEHSQGFFIC